MLILNAFTKLQAGLLSAFAALAMAVEPTAQPVEELEDIIAPADEAAGDEELAFTDEGDPSAREREWQCYRDTNRETRGYCLADCDNDDDDGHHFDNDDGDYRRVTGKIKIRGNRDMCRKRARQYCRSRGERLDNWCFGDRGWDRDDDDGRH